MFKWEKKGMIFSPNGYSEWMYSHAQCPFTFDFGEYIRIYFSTREAYKEGMSKAHGGWIDVDKKDLKKVIRIAKEPMMELGEIGEFDEFGSMPNSIVKVGQEYYLYFCGWTRALSTPYCWEIGLAKGTDGKYFKKVGRGPIIGSTMEEPYLHACPQVYRLGENALLLGTSSVGHLCGIHKNLAIRLVLRSQMICLVVCCNMLQVLLLLWVCSF